MFYVVRTKIRLQADWIRYHTPARFISNSIKIANAIKRPTRWLSFSIISEGQVSERKFERFEPEVPKYTFHGSEDLSSLSVEEINYWLSKFCVDARQKNGEEYRHKVLYSLFCAINCVIRESKPELALFNVFVNVNNGLS